MQADDPAHAQIFAARLRPHRSLNRRNFHLLLALFAGAAFVISIPFLVLGAWPVVGFMGLDVALFWWAFRANFRAARACEDVVVTPLELAVRQISAKGAHREWRFNPAWVRLQRHEDAEYGLERLDIVSRGRHLEIGSFLGPQARADFADELARALAEARRGPRYS